MKSVAIMQPYVFPYIGYFQLITAVDEFVFLDDVNFIKKGWINRNYLYSKQGALLFTIPLTSTSQNQTIQNTSIFYGEDWAKKLIRQIEQNYGKAPYFKEVLPIAQAVFQTKWDSISKLAIESIIATFRYLDVPFNFKLSSDMKIEGLAGQERIISINKTLGADRYINASGGKELYENKHFIGAGIDLKFLEASKFEYNQFNKPNTQPYSILDALMFNSRQSVREALASFALVDATIKS